MNVNELDGIDDRIISNFVDAGLRGECANTGSVGIMPYDIFMWYMRLNRTASQNT